MAKKIRVDELMVKRGLANDIAHAKALVMSGIVYMGEVRLDSGALKISEDDLLELRGKNKKFVSRGGLKLEKAMNCFHINLENKLCMDIGASTGGFTDCMLQSGAKKVYSVDVGYGQLAWKLRNDSRVVNLERTNIKNVTFEFLGEKIDFASADVSFISLKHVFSALTSFLTDNGETAVLIKPQFEAKREDVGEKGVVRDPAVHIQTINYVISYALEYGFSVMDLTYSPVKGPEGNIEYLCFAKYDGQKNNFVSEDKITQTVSEAHSLPLPKH